MTITTGDNIALALKDMARENPDGASVILQRAARRTGELQYRVITFARLDQWSDHIAAGLKAHGITRGMRTALFVPPGPELFATVFALFKIAAIPVLIDPGIGMRHMKSCLANARPETFIGIPKALFARKIFRWAWGTVKHTISVGPKWGLASDTLADIEKQGMANDFFEPEPTQPDDTAAILFTSGSTGPPKGVVYTHKIFLDQVHCLREMYDIQPGECDISTFPLFALFGPALGMTAIIPDMDATRPAEVDPVRIIDAANEWRATNLFGSPALLETVSKGGERLKAKIPTLRRVLSSGAPARPATLRRFAKMLNPDARIHTPYGATESLPVATIDHKTILEETAPLTAKGHGMCVGHPAPRVEIKIIKTHDEPIEEWSDTLEIPQGQIGEIIVHGPRTTSEYFNSDHHTKLAKIPHADGEVWHRMGDLGYIDEQGRVWFCGRKSHRVRTKDETLYTVACERIFDQHPQVFRTALVGIGDPGSERPVLCVQLTPDKSFKSREKKKVIAELRQIAAEYTQTQNINDYLIHKSFPVDIRHNAKIYREKLKEWATKEIK
jgi:olefin beta-lactone synthetase